MPPAIAFLNRASSSIGSSDRMVAKRDGSLVKFSPEKITRAIALAFFSVKSPGEENPYKEDLFASYGLDSDAFVKVTAIAENVSQMLEFYYQRGVHPTIEEVQDTVGKAIAAAGEWAAAQAFVTYRATRASRRLNRYADNGMSEYIALAKYARYREDLGRRETFSEGVARVRDMHLKKFEGNANDVLSAETDLEAISLAGAQRPLLAKRFNGKTLGAFIYECFERVNRKEALPSMRSMQFGGIATLSNHARIYNCAFSNVDRVEFFREYFFLLLSGCGCGFSVQKHHIGRLPVIPVRTEDARRQVVHHTIPDDIRGWADSLHVLFSSYLEGFCAEFNFSEIRPEGAPLKTSGGKAPGHLPLKKALLCIEAILEQAGGRQLTSLEIYDINCFIADAVLSGGIRRSATICLFSPDDVPMMQAKTGKWYETHPYRANSNNSAVLPRGAENEPYFRALFEAQKTYGEPGFYFCDDPDAGANPCVEIGLHPVVNWELSEEEWQRLLSYGYKGDLPGTTRLSGWQMCNLSTINAAAINTPEDFFHACITATAVGTLQASYTTIDYLSPVTRIINEHDALLGVSICGFMENPEILFDAEVLRAGALLCRATNRLVAKAIGIRPAARLTCVKPEGTASLILGCPAGIHPYHAEYFFRRVTANRNEQLYKFFRSVNPQMTEAKRKSKRDDFLVFPVAAPKKAITRKNIKALEFLELVRLVQQTWVAEGTAADNRSPAVRHNVSNTVTVRDDEWQQVADFIWANRTLFTGISLIAYFGESVYDQAPNEEVDPNSEVQVARWNALQPKPVDYTLLIEDGDATDHRAAPACAGGACAVT